VAKKVRVASGLREQRGYKKRRGFQSGSPGRSSNQCVSEAGESLVCSLLPASNYF